jgi:hypothetical protein
MWPFKKRQQFADAPMSFTQLDFTDGFADDEGIGSADWIATKALNAFNKDPESMGLPSTAAGADEVYRIAAALSAIRESLPLDRDGVYCPICHIANVDRGKLRTPCPKCGRALLQFGWT